MALLRGCVRPRAAHTVMQQGNTTVPAFRYDTTGNWYKGNTHLHSTASDGGKTFTELAQMYADAGYDFLFRTDHWVASDVAADEEPSPLVWLDGIELDGRDHGGSDHHVVCLAAITGIVHEMGFVAALEAARAQDALLILAHPYWIGNSLEDALRWGFHGVEVYNHVCQWLNGKGIGTVHWNGMLERFPNTLAFAADDAHIRPEHPGWNGGWIVVNAPACSQEAIQNAIRGGNFYASCGPVFHTVECDGRNVIITTSPVQFVRLVGPGHLGNRIGTFDDALLSKATFEIPGDWPYAYLELEDAQGRRAWTSSLLVADT